MIPAAWARQQELDEQEGQRGRGTFQPRPQPQPQPSGSLAAQRGRQLLRNTFLRRRRTTHTAYDGHRGVPPVGLMRMSARRTDGSTASGRPAVGEWDVQPPVAQPGGPGDFDADQGDYADYVAHLAFLEAPHQPRWSIHPSSPRKLVWDLLIAVLTLYTAVVLMWRLAFQVSVEGPWLALDIAVDAVFVLDMVVSARTGYEDVNGEVTWRDMLRCASAPRLCLSWR